MKQSNRRTPEQKKEILARIEESRRSGLTADEAREKEGIAHAQYYSWRKQLKPAKVKTSKPKNRPTKVVNFTIPESTPEQLVILIGSQTHVSQALAQLAQIRGARV